MLAESIIIILLLLINVSAVFAGVVSEHRYQLKTLRSLGYTDQQMIFSIIKGSLKLSIPVILIGTLIGIGLSNLLLITNNTILFGHRFVPQFPLQYWLINLIVGHFLMYFGAWFGLLLEDETILNAD